LPPPDDFSLADLHAALDDQRRARGLAWPEAAREIGVSPSTLAGLVRRSAAEADGVLQMLLWLRRSPESFVPGHPWPERPDMRLPGVPAGQTLRIDAARLHAALDSALSQRAVSRAQLARELAVGASSLARLASGGRTSFPLVMRLSGWLSRPLAAFVHASER